MERDPVTILERYVQYYVERGDQDSCAARFAADLRYCSGYIVALRVALQSLRQQPESGGKVAQLLTQIQTSLQAISAKEVTVDRTLQELVDDISSERTQISSLATLVTGLRQRVIDALSGVTLPPTVQAQINQAFDGVEENKAAIVAAMNDNVVPPVVAPSPSNGASTTPATPSNTADATIPPATPADTVPGSNSSGT